jgi:small subunit ribosomal protein S8
LEFAVSASENWLIKVKFLALEKLAGNTRREVRTMTFTDPIADMLTRIRNANMVKHASVDVPASNMKKRLAEILAEEGFIKGFDVIDDGKQGIIRIDMKYHNNDRVISGLKRISKPGLRVYANKAEVPKVLGGLGIAVISTSNGIITDKAARKLGVGGEVICYVW